MQRELHESIARCLMCLNQTEEALSISTKLVNKRFKKKRVFKKLTTFYFKNKKGRFSFKFRRYFKIIKFIDYLLLTQLILKSNVNEFKSSNGNFET